MAENGYPRDTGQPAPKWGKVYRDFGYSVREATTGMVITGDAILHSGPHARVDTKIAAVGATAARFGAPGRRASSTRALGSADAIADTTNGPAQHGEGLG